MEQTEKRVHTRAQFFLVRRDEDYVGVFALRSNADVRAIAALVVDVSEGGMQVLCGPSTALQQARYHLEPIASAPEGQNSGSWPVRSVWSRPEGMYVRSGLSFEAPVERVSELMALLRSSEHQLLRCVLHPLD